MTMTMRYPLLHKENGVLVGLRFLIYDRLVVEGRCCYSEITTKGVTDAGTLERVDVQSVRHRRRPK
jgi:hypothetical protein